MKNGGHVTGNLRDPARDGALLSGDEPAWATTTGARVDRGYVDGLTLNNIQFDYISPDCRPFMWLGGVKNRNISGIKVPFGATSPIAYEPSETEVVSSPATPRRLQPQAGAPTHSPHRAQHD
jgi:hypothetical protein